MDRERAWTHYFETGDREPLIKAYEDSIKYLAWTKYPSQKEDMVQVGMMGLLKAIDRIDVNRVKSKDAWVWLNVKGMMYNVTQSKPTELLEVWHTDGQAVTDDLTHEVIDINWAISKLPARQRLIYKLIYEKGWYKTEIADLLGISSMRVGQIEQQILTKLRTGTQVVKRPL